MLPPGAIAAGTQRTAAPSWGGEGAPKTLDYVPPQAIFCDCYIQETATPLPKPKAS